MPMSIDSKVDTKSQMDAQGRIVINAVEHSDAWQEHSKKHKDAKLSVKMVEDSSIYPAEDLTGRIGFSGMRHMLSVGSNSQSQESWAQNQEARKQGLNDLGIQGEKQFNWLKQQEHQKEQNAAGKLYGQAGDAKNQAANVYSQSSQVTADFKATCGCGMDFTGEAHTALGAMQHGEQSKPGYVNSSSSQAGGYRGGGSGSQPHYAGGGSSGYKG